MRVASESRRGCRATNDDVVFISDDLIVLADGMGGHAGGRQAAQMAVGAALARLVILTERSLHEAFDAANRAVREHQLATPGHADAGCTLTIVGVREVPALGLQAIVGHAGDSPAFLVRNGDMTLLTPPHTEAERLRRSGRITADQAASHPSRSTLRRSIGGQTPEPELTTLLLEDGDQLLVCSDGLLDVPDRRELRRLACGPGSPHDIVAELVGYALQSSSDNVTVALLDVAGPDGATIRRSD